MRTPSIWLDVMVWRYSWKSAREKQLLKCISRRGNLLNGNLWQLSFLDAVLRRDWYEIKLCLVYFSYYSLLDLCFHSECSECSTLMLSINFCLQWMQFLKAICSKDSFLIEQDAVWDTFPITFAPVFFWTRRQTDLLNFK